MFSLVKIICFTKEKVRYVKYSHYLLCGLSCRGPHSIATDLINSYFFYSLFERYVLVLCTSQRKMGFNLVLAFEYGTSQLSEICIGIAEIISVCKKGWCSPFLPPLFLKSLNTNNRIEKTNNKCVGQKNKTHISSDVSISDIIGT